MSIATRELAVKWALRLQGPEFTEAETAALQRWLLADPTHLDALDEAWLVVTAGDDLAPERQAEFLAEVLAEDGTSEARSSEVQPSATEPARVRSRWRIYALAASAVFATVLGVLWFAAIEGWLPRTYRTGTSETRIVKLPDGSVVHLNAKTTVRWSGFTRDRRTELVAGQALFQVVHDPAHPFYVRADGGIVRVLGTKFDLNRHSDTTILTVLEGRVAVSNSAESAGDGWRRIVYANQRLTYGATGLIDDVGRVDASRSVRWREFTLDLDRQPLSTVVEELSRYTDQPILLSDDQLRTRRVGGTLQVRDIRQALRDLEAIAPVVVSQDEGAFVLNQRASIPPSGQ